jgi:hypothetical protein
MAQECFDLGRTVMPTNNQRSRQLSAKLGGLIVIVVGAVVAAVLFFAIMYRSGSFSVVAQGQGIGAVEFKFAENKVSFSEVLDRLLTEQPGSEVDAASRQRLIANILRAHNFYYIPSDDAVSALRRMKETQGTREFMRAVRSLLYDLAGPFSPPDTFVEAPDARLLQALNDLYESSPSNPLAVSLWEMNLNLQGIFNPRTVDVTVQVDDGLSHGVAATCTGSPLLDKQGVIQLFGGNDDRMITVLIQKPKMCEPTKAKDMLAGKETKVWISLADMNNLITETRTSNVGVHAKLQPQAKGLTD